MAYAESFAAQFVQKIDLLVEAQYISGYSTGAVSLALYNLFGNITTRSYAEIFFDNLCVEIHALVDIQLSIIQFANVLDIHTRTHVMLHSFTGQLYRAVVSTK